ncbi:MAG: hypothetical protein ABW056_12005 [Thermoanaerobaculia bacterium]
MRRLTQRIGLFGGPGAMMTAKKIKRPPLKGGARGPDDNPAEPQKPDEPAPAARKSWLQRFFGSDDDSEK